MEEQMQYLIIDTNIVLLDATNILTLSSPDTIVVIPETVVDEIDSKKSIIGELGYQAREFGRLLSKATKLSTEETEYLTAHRFVIGEDHHIHIVTSSAYPNFTDTEPNIRNDRKIIEIALQYKNIFGPAVTFISNDVMCRVRADSLGLPTEDLKEVDTIHFEFTKTIDLPMDLFLDIHDKPIDLVNKSHTQSDYNYKFTSADTSEIKFAYISQTGLIKVIGKETAKELRDASKQPAPPINSEQLMLSRAILDQSIDLIVVDSPAGTGKTITALSNAMRLVSTNTPYESIMYIRTSVSDLDKAEEIGFLPGLEEKFAPYLNPVTDSLDFIARKQHPRQKGQKVDDYETYIEEQIAHLRSKYNIQAMIGLGLRGRTFSNAVVIIDEAQNISKASMQRILTRFGKNCKIIIIGSQRQIDNAYITKYNNGLSVILDSCTKPSDLIRKYAINLTKVVRSPFAEWSEKVFSKS